METAGNGLTDNPEGATARRRLLPWLKAALTVVAGAALIVGCGGSEALSEDDFVGMWVSADGVWVQFDEDGTLTGSVVAPRVVAAAEALGLADGTLERGRWSFDGSEFTWAADEDSPGGCGGQVDRYTVEPAGDGAVQWTAISDNPCQPRTGDLERGPMRPHAP